MQHDETRYQLSQIMTTTVNTVCKFLDQFAPPALAEDWDNVGLLVGDGDMTVTKLMTCLTVTPASAEEAIDAGCEMIVTHHPLPFHPLKRLTTESTPGRMLLDLIRAGVAIYSPHTAFDSAAAGINQRLAEGLQLTHIEPLVAIDDAEDIGSGRCGRIASGLTVADMVQRLKAFLSITGMHVVGALDKPVTKVAVACGSAGQFLAPARRVGCDLLVTGETNFHTCLEAEACGVALLLPGHYASERFAVECLADVLLGELPELDIWASRREADPVQWV